MCYRGRLLYKIARSYVYEYSLLVRMAAQQKDPLIIILP